MHRVAVAQGDGIGSEIMDATLAVFKAAGVPIEFVPVEMGLSVWENGVPAGITDEAKQTIEDLGVLFKGPMATPSGKGVKSINVTARKTWNTYANKRIFRTLNGVPRGRYQHPDIDITMVRENIEDTYGAIEHMQTHDVAQCRRLITRPGSEAVVRYAFEVARRKGARRITAGHKANIMKLTDGLFLEVFREVAKEYPDINSDDRIVDAMAMELVMKPNSFDVIVLPNLQGDILSDLCAGLVGGLAYAPSANIGDHIAIFEAVHGTAPDIAGQGLANPTALMLSGCIMLRHLGLMAWADQIEAALEKAHRNCFRAPDLGCTPVPFQTQVFRDLVIEALEPVDLEHTKNIAPALRAPARDTQRMMTSPRAGSETTKGVDLFIDSDATPTHVAEVVNAACPAGMSVVMISNRGTQVWPTGSVFTDCVNHHRVRVESDTVVENAAIYTLAADVSQTLRVCSTEALLQIDNEAQYSLAQGQ